MLKLKRFDQAVWFDYPGAEGVKLKIRPLSKKASLDCMARASRLTMKIEEDGKMTTVENPSQFIFMWEVFRNCLVEWSGIEFTDVKDPARETVLEGLFEIDGIKDFVYMKAQELLKKETDQLEGELKNSVPSQDG